MQDYKAMVLQDVHIMMIYTYFSTSIQLFSWEKLVPGGTQNHISYKLGKPLNYLDNEVHSFPVNSN